MCVVVLVRCGVGAFTDLLRNYEDPFKNFQVAKKGIFGPFEST